MCETKKCIVCERVLPKTSYYFRKHPNTVDGLNHKCKECLTGNKIFAKEGYAYCTECQNEYPKTTEYFYRDRNTEKGFTSKCKICLGDTYALSGRYGLFNIKWKELKTISGIYKITCVPTGKIYIGSTVNFCSRWSVHLDLLKKNKHENNYFQNAFNKYGFENFKFEIIDYVEDLNKLIEAEQKWLDYYKSYDRNIGFNILKVAGNCLGYIPSEETKLKLSKATGKEVNQYDLHGNYINTYHSVNFASKSTKISKSAIINSLNKKKLSTSGYIWIYKDSLETIEDRLEEIDKNTRRIMQYNLDGTLVKEWKTTIKEISNQLGKEFIHIPNSILGKGLSVGGYMWKYRNYDEPIEYKIDSYEKRMFKIRSEANAKRTKKNE